MVHNFQRYLSAKRSVDDRALNRVVWGQMSRQLVDWQNSQPVSILEVGAGIGTMLQRMQEWGAFFRGTYTLVDERADNLAFARKSLSSWASQVGLEVNQQPDRYICLQKTGQSLEVRFQPVAIETYLKTSSDSEKFDLLIAHAVLDLFDIPEILPQIASLVTPGGLLYLTINFDGETIFEPVHDPIIEHKVLDLYHRSMDERITAGKPSGDSRAGRHLFQYLSQANLELLSSGSSDWVVYPVHGAYPGDEAYFLHFILHFFEESLRQQANMNDEVLDDWLAERRSQVERGELVYIAHQLDFLARKIF